MVHVRCSAGYRADETPVTLTINDRDIEIVAVIERWLTPEHRFFKVRGSNGGTYVLRHKERNDQWDLPEIGP